MKSFKYTDTPFPMVVSEDVPLFTEAEMDIVHVVFHAYAERMAHALETDQLTEGQYEAFEVFYDKLIYFMDGKVLQ